MARGKNAKSKQKAQKKVEKSRRQIETLENNNCIGIGIRVRVPIIIPVEATPAPPPVIAGDNYAETEEEIAALNEERNGLVDLVQSVAVEPSSEPSSPARSSKSIGDDTEYS